MPHTVLLVGHDAAPTRAFSKLGAYLREDNINVKTILLDRGTVPAPDRAAIEHVARQCDVVLIGMSTPKKNAAVECIAADICRELRVPYGFYSDTHGAWTRKHFERLLDEASFLMVVSEEERARAKQSLTGLRINVSYTGNPLWNEFLRPADKNRARALVDIRDGEFFILAPGTKSAMHNFASWTALIQATAQQRRHCRVVLSLHPGDPTPVSAYEQLVEFGAALYTDVVITDSRIDEHLKSDALLPGADLVVNGTSARVHAVARRIYAIDYFEPLSMEWHTKDTGEPTSYLADVGAVRGLYGETWTDLAKAISEAIENPGALRSAQEGAVTIIPESDVFAKMYEVLAHFLK